MLELVLLELRRVDESWILALWAISVFSIAVFFIRELYAWFSKVNTLISLQEDTLRTLEDIRELLSAWVEESVEEKKETVTDMLEKKPNEKKEEKEKPQK